MENNPTDNQLIKFLDSDVHIHEPLHPDMSQRQPRHVSNKGSECEDCGKWSDEMEWLDNGIGSGFYYSPANSITLTLEWMLERLRYKRIVKTVSFEQLGANVFARINFKEKLNNQWVLGFTAFSEKLALRGAVVELYKEENDG